MNAVSNDDKIPALIDHINPVEDKISIIKTKILKTICENKKYTAVKHFIESGDETLLPTDCRFFVSLKRDLSIKNNLIYAAIP